MAKTALVWVASSALWLALGCGDKSEAKATPESLGPPLSVLELPVSLRTGDPAPSDARKLEITINDMRVDDQLVLKLEGGRVPAAEQKDGVVPKLVAALQNPARARLALHVHASLPYDTAALALSSASSAGVHQLTFRVRKSGVSTDTGWLSLDGFQMTPRTDDEVVVQGVPARKWDDFAKAWQAMHDSCRSSKTGNCPIVENSVAQGGNLKIVLFASGSGVNLHFYRVGLTQAELAAEEQKRKAELAGHAGHKKGLVHERAAKTDLEAEMLEGPPASEALFQFRGREATDPPSVLTEVMQPLCGPRACGAVVSADGNTSMVRVISLIGAAFADGTAPAKLAFEMPWTPKPKAAAPPVAPVAPSGPASAR
jgi:hypothetical protein